MQKKGMLIGVFLILMGGLFANTLGISKETNLEEYAMLMEEHVSQIKRIEAKFKVSITYESILLEQIEKERFSKALATENITDALKTLLKGTELSYKKMRKDFYIIVETESTPVELNDSISLLEGTIYDENGITMPGANVYIKETENGTITNIDGNFNLVISEEAKILVVRFVGYQLYEQRIKGAKEFKIQLQLESIGLDEIVVSGVAGKTSTKKLTVTVAKIKADQLNEAPASSAATSLQGKIAGVKITQAYGTPGSGANIRLRGSTSITGNQAPLILVDGNIFEGSLGDVNVDDIESIEVVKGAAAASLYGSKAGSGVVIITTKRGNDLKVGKTLVTVRNEFGTSNVSKTIDLAEHHSYQLSADYEDFSYYTKYKGVRYDDDGNIVRGSRKLDVDHYADNEYGFINDNQDNFFNPGNYYTNYISLANRNKKTNVFLSFENNKQEGVLFETEGYKRQNFRVNVDHRLNDKLKISTSNLLINAVSDNPGSNDAFFDLMFLSPDVDLTEDNEDGTPYILKPDPWSLEENPLYPLHYRERKSTRSTLLSNIILNYDPLDWLNINAKYTNEKQWKHWTTYTPRGYLYSGGQYIDGSIYKEEYSSDFQTFQATANVNKQFNEFTVKGKVSYLYEDKNYYDFSVTGREFLTANIPQLNNTNAEQSSMNSYEGIVRAENIFGIVDFDYKDRYLFSALYRKDGSSLFGENERWNDYYRVSAAYRLTEDIHIPGFNELKLRAAFGTAGQRPGFSNQYETWNIVSGALQKSTLGNKNLKPSESEELELALDASLFHKVNVQLSYSQTTTTDVFALAPLASHLGYPSQWQNVGDLSAWVYEATVEVFLIEKNDFKWKINFAFDHIRQQITKLNIPEYKTGPLNAFLIKEGETLGSIYGYKWLTSLEEMEQQLQIGQTIDQYMLNSDGYVIPVETEGTVNEIPILWDKDANGVGDLTRIGDGNSDFNLSFNTTFKWKDFSFYALLDWKHGGDVYNYTHQYTFRDNRAVEFDQFGKSDDQKKTIDYYATFYNHTAMNSYFIEDASYLKLRELSMYYSIPVAKLGNMSQWISMLRLGVKGHNLYTITNYSGYDPEVASGTDLSNFPFDNFGYPNYRTFTASLEIRF